MTNNRISIQFDRVKPFSPEQGEGFMIDCSESPGRRQGSGPVLLGSTIAAIILKFFGEYCNEIRSLVAHGARVLAQREMRRRAGRAQDENWVGAHSLTWRKAKRRQAAAEEH